MNSLATPAERKPSAGPSIQEQKPLVAPIGNEIDQNPCDQRASESSGTSESKILSIEPSVSLPSVEYDAPMIPESYRETIGPVVRSISFGERIQDFEAEPVDVSWAQAMEIGINDFIASHGPEYGEVFEFVQCRSSSCVLAGYTIPGYESQGASVIGTLRRQPWWQASGRASSTHRDGEGRISFVTIIRRYDE